MFPLSPPSWVPGLCLNGRAGVSVSLATADEKAESPDKAQKSPTAILSQTPWINLPQLSLE